MTDTDNPNDNYQEWRLNEANGDMVELDMTPSNEDNVQDTELPIMAKLHVNLIGEAIIAKQTSEDDCNAAVSKIDDEDHLNHDIEVAGPSIIELATENIELVSRNVDTAATEPSSIQDNNNAATNLYDAGHPNRDLENAAKSTIKFNAKNTQTFVRKHSSHLLPTTHTSSQTETKHLSNIIIINDETPFSPKVRSKSARIPLHHRVFALLLCYSIVSMLLLNASHTQTVNGKVQVILLQSTTTKQIQLHELQVYSSGNNHNIAPSGVASQSSTLHVEKRGANFFSAHKANDSNNRTFSHTNDPNAWLRIDLPAPIDVDRVVIFNRECPGEAILLCLCRLSFAKLILLNSNGDTVTTRTIGNTCDVQTIVQDFSSRANKKRQTSIDTDRANSIMDASFRVNKGKRYLVAELAGGLTNQAIEIWVALLLAEKLHRTLVLPRLFVKIPSDSSVNYADRKTSKPEPFNVIWDEAHFVECARKNLNNPDLSVVSDSAHYKVKIQPDHAYRLQQWDGVDRFTPIINYNASNALASRLMSDPSEYVEINNPFHWDIGYRSNFAQCFKPSSTLQKKVDYYKSLLPNNYSCLHARTEEDWYALQCCMEDAEVNTTSIRPELWTCSEFARSKQCYMTPTQIVDVLKTNLALHSPLWISSGSSREALQPIYDSFEVYTNKDYVSGAFMDYRVAEVDFAVCSGATTFWGMDGSSYSMSLERIIRENGRTFWYA